MGRFSIAERQTGFGAVSAKRNFLSVEIRLLPAKEDDFLNILPQLEQLLSLAFKNAVHDAFNLCH